MTAGQTRPRSVLLAGGGSAGHVSPLLALADALRERDAAVRITALGVESGLEQRLVPARGYDLRSIPKVIFPRRPSGAATRLPRDLRGAVAAAGAVIDDVAADVVVGFGGYVSSPAYLAARRRGIPVVVHEQNARPGLANRLGARLTPYVATTFASTRLTGARVVGMPLRREIARLDRPAHRAEALAAFGLADHRPTLLVTGGSLGAQRLNAAFADRVAALRSAGVQVLHLTGAAKEFVAEPAAGSADAAETDSRPAYVVVAYADRMDLAYSAADLVVARAGANTVCELTAVGLPAVYVPLPIGNGEQRFNAADVVRAGGGLLVDDAELTPAWVDRVLLPLADDTARLEAMAAAARSVGVRDGDERLADLVYEAAAAGRRATRSRRLGGRRRPPVVLTVPAARDVPAVADGVAAADAVAAPDAPAPAPGRFDLTVSVPAPDSLGPVHLIAIGGAGMSAVARLLLQAGIPVSGSDAKDSAALQALATLGAQVHVGHDPAYLGEAQTVVVSSAIREDNPELVAARDRGLRVLHRSQALASLMSGRQRVAVAGANGKTTTTAMLTVALQSAGAAPGYAIGGEPVQLGSNADLGAGSVFVAEADESDGSFLAYRPFVAVVTNVQPDHLDFYGDFAAVQRAYDAFAASVQPDGLLVACADDAGSRQLADVARARGQRVRTYGVEESADVRVADLRSEGLQGSATLLDGELQRSLRLQLPGRHNLLDAAAAYTAATHGLGQDVDAVLAGLASFTGTRRRFEPVGEAGGVRIVDDYAHNPGKLAALVETARGIAGAGRLVVAFQPHLYSRTRDFADAFARSLAHADVVLVTDVYAAREDPLPGVSGALVSDRVAAAATESRESAGSTGSTVDVHYVPDVADLTVALGNLVRPGDLVVTVGAGDITSVGPELLALLRSRPDEGDGAPAPDADDGSDGYQAHHTDDGHVAPDARGNR